MTEAVSIGRMIAMLKPYPIYKDSGSPWIGQIPSEWDIRQVRHLGRLLKGTGGSKDDASTEGVACIRYGELYTTYTYTIRASSGFVTRRRARAYTPIQYGDVLFAASGETIEEIGKSAVNLIEEPVVCGGDVIILRPRVSVHAAFLGYAMDSRPAIDQKSTMGRGTTVKHIYPAELRALLCPIPSSKEQESVVTFLDWVTRRFNKTIRSKRKVIRLLNEQKSVIIQNTVLRGIDPSAPLRASGVRWVGDIPRHWDVLRAKYVYREVDERSTRGGEELLSVSHITGVTPRSQKNITMFKAASYAGHKLCKPGDLVINTMWAWMGALGVSNYGGIVSPGYAVYRPWRPGKLIGEYIDGLLRSRPYLSNILCRSTGLRGSRLRLYPDAFFRIPLILPPAHEQRQIVRAISTETANLDRAIDRLQTEIGLLDEYRDRLVADVVTGKLDVRPAAGLLPADDALDTGEDDEGRQEIASEEMTV